MRIVQVEDFFHPNSGYQINILSKYFSKFGHDVTVVCSELDKMPDYLNNFFTINKINEDDKEYENKTGVRIIRVPIWGYISGRSLYRSNIFKVVDELKPDILFVHSEDTAIAIQYLWKIEKKPYALVMDNHQCDMSSHNKFREVFRWFYRLTCTPIIKRNEYKTVRLVEDDHYMQDHFDIPIELTPCITFGSDTLLFHPDEQVKKSFRDQYGIPEDAFVVVYAGKLDEYKGGKFLADTLKEKFDTKKEIVFLVVGNTSGEYGKSVEEIFSNSENRILRFPTQKYVDLAPFFQAADIAIFAKECSLTFYDVQACGLPVVSEDNEINVERCTHNNGYNFKKGNIADFRSKIQLLSEMEEEKFREMASASEQFILQNYNYEEKAREFEKLMITEIKRQRKKKHI